MYSQNFFTKPFHEYEQETLHRLREEIGRASELEINKPEYLDELITRYKLSEVVIDWDSLRVGSKPREVTKTVRGYYGEQHVSVAVYTFEVSFTGDERLFNLQPGVRRVWRFEGKLMDRKMVFEIEGSDKGALDSIKNNLGHDIPQLNSHVSPYNSQVVDVAQNAYNARRKQLQSQSEGVNVFGVPVKDE